MSTATPAAPLDFKKHEDGGYAVSTGTYADITVDKHYIAPGLPTGRWEARWQGRKGWGSTRKEAVQDLIERHQKPKLNRTA